MKTYALFFLIALAASSPIVEVRQRGRVGTTATEFTDGGCRDIIMLFARGSTEAGNMGTICGPPTANGLKEVFGADAVAVEGIDYGALISTNFARGGADPAGISEMQRLIQQATTQCPDSKLIVGGYSQGAALTHRAVENLPQAQKDNIVAAFTFGDTQNEQVRQSCLGSHGQCDLQECRTTDKFPTFLPTRQRLFATEGMPCALGLLPSYHLIWTIADEHQRRLTFLLHSCRRLVWQQEGVERQYEF
jgi:cutinase